MWLPKVTLEISDRHYKVAEILADLYKTPIILWLSRELENQIESYTGDAQDLGEKMAERVGSILEWGA